jgi:hypothetical protein
MEEAQLLSAAILLRLFGKEIQKRFINVDTSDAAQV